MYMEANCVSAVCEVDDRRLRLGRQVVAHLGHLRLDLREGGVGVVVQVQVRRDRADALRAGRLHVVDPVRARDHALERRRQEPADQVGVGADVDRRNLDDGRVAAGVLPDGQRTDRLHARDQDHEVDDDREDRPSDEKVGEGLHSSCPPVWAPGCCRAGLVVDLDGGSVAQLEDAGGHHGLPRLDAGGHRHLVAAGSADLDELLAHAEVGLAALRILDLLDDEHRVAVRRVGDGGSGDRHRRVRSAHADIRLDEHARAQRAVLVVHRRLHLDVARRLVDDRVERRDLAVRGDADGPLGRDVDGESDLQLRHLLLRDGEVDVDGPDRLQRHHRRPAVEVLAEIHLADPQNAREGRPDRLALDGGADLADLGVGLLVLGVEPVEVGLGLDALFDQALRALEVQVRELLARLRPPRAAPLPVSYPAARARRRPGPSGPIRTRSSRRCRAGLR